MRPMVFKFPFIVSKFECFFRYCGTSSQIHGNYQCVRIHCCVLGGCMTCVANTRQWWKDNTDALREPEWKQRHERCSWNGIFAVCVQRYGYWKIGISNVFPMNMSPCCTKLSTLFIIELCQYAYCITPIKCFSWLMSFRMSTCIDPWTICEWKTFKYFELRLGTEELVVAYRRVCISSS